MGKVILQKPGNLDSMLDLATNFGVTLPGWEADLGACFLICKMQGLHLCDL